MLDDDDFALLRLWKAYRGGDFAPGHLPASGGVMDQPACVLDAFAIMDATFEAVKPKPPE